MGRTEEQAGTIELLTRLVGGGRWLREHDDGTVAFGSGHRSIRIAPDGQLVSGDSSSTDDTPDERDLIELAFIVAAGNTEPDELAKRAEQVRAGTGLLKNEGRADRGQQIVDAFTDRNYAGLTDGERAVGLRLDITDAIADLLHLGDRHGLDPRDLSEKAQHSHEGDMEDGPPATAGLFDQVLRSVGGDRVEAAIRIGRDLMRGDVAQHKAGYTAENAALAAVKVFGLDDSQVSDLCRELEADTEVVLHLAERDRRR